MFDREAARKWLVISALVVAGVWGYRKYRETASDPAEAGKTIMKAPEFITAWGAVYFTLAMIAEAAPRFAGSFAVLIMTGDLLTQGQQIIKDVTSQQGTKSTATPAAATTPTGATPAGGAFASPAPTPAQTAAAAAVARSHPVG